MTFNCRQPIKGSHPALYKWPSDMQPQSFVEKNAPPGKALNKQFYFRLIFVLFRTIEVSKNIIIALFYKFVSNELVAAIQLLLFDLHPTINELIQLGIEIL